MHPIPENRPSYAIAARIPQNEFHVDSYGPGHESPRIVFTTATESYLDLPLRRQDRRDDVDQPEAHEQRRVALGRGLGPAELEVVRGVTSGMLAGAIDTVVAQLPAHCARPGSDAQAWGENVEQLFAMAKQFVFDDASLHQQFDTRAEAGAETQQGNWMWVAHLGVTG